MSLRTGRISHSVVTLRESTITPNEFSPFFVKRPKAWAEAPFLESSLPILDRPKTPTSKNLWPVLMSYIMAWVAS